MSERELPAIPESDHRARRWRLLGDLLTFQVKLFVDGVKDLVLAPVALVAVGAGLLMRRDAPGLWFYRLLHMGRRFDAWVDLFGATEHRALPPAEGEAPSSQPPPSAGIDGMVGQLEAVLREQYARGGLTAKAKDAIDRALDRVHGSRDG